MTSAVVLAIPAKGRLMDAANGYLTSAGLKVKRLGSSRNYKGLIEGIDDIEVRFLSASEIASGLTSGDLHLGITGRDLLHESTPEPDKHVLPLSPLGFGHADVVVAVPAAWIDVTTMADLGEVVGDFRAKHHRPLRVATKYMHLTRTFFAEKGISDYRIVESLGATEGAPAAGTAEVIVDITSSGATLAANRLKVLQDGLILSSQAFLTASKGAAWQSSQMETAKAMLDRIAARDRAQRLAEVRTGIEQAEKSAVIALLEKSGAILPFGWPTDGESEIVIHVDKNDAYDLVANLRNIGCTNATSRDLKYIFTEKNPLFEALESIAT